MKLLSISGKEMYNNKIYTYKMTAYLLCMMQAKVEESYIVLICLEIMQVNCLLYFKLISVTTSM